MIGATTLDEYRKHIEKDAALERRFQPVMVDEPTEEDAISILRGLRERLEIFHGVKIQDGALVAAVVLSHRYISDRFLPDKAIDLVDEACAMLRTEIDSMPAELDELTRRLMRLEIEEAALAKEKDKASKARLEELRKELADVRAEVDALRGAVGGRAPGAQEGADPAGADRAAPPGGRQRRAGLRPQPRRAAAPRGAARAGAPARSRGGAAPGQAGHPAPAPRGRHRGGDRGDRVALDRHPREPAAGGRAREAAPARRGAPRARRRPGRGGAAGGRRHHPRPLGDQGSAAADRLVHLPRPDGRREDRARTARWPKRCSTPSRTWSAST